MNKPFTEIDPSLRKERFVLTPQWYVQKDVLVCMQRTGTGPFGLHLYCKEVADYSCPVCNGYFCLRHASDINIPDINIQRGDNTLWLCLNCAKLTHDERERVMALRTAIERGVVESEVRAL